MVLFGRKKKQVSPEELAAKEENAKKLAEFQVTKAWGVKKYATAMQFIYDEAAKRFVVVEGPEETFRDREPWVVDFSQATKVSLEVVENWQEEKSEYATKGFGTLYQDQYDEVWWRYDFYIIIETTHPYAGTIRFQTNFKPNILQVPSRGLFVRRGLELNGTFTGESLDAAVAKLDEMLKEEPEAIQRKQTFNLLTNNAPDSVLGRLQEDAGYAQYLKTLENISKHVRRAQRIGKLIG